MSYVKTAEFLYFLSSGRVESQPQDVCVSALISSKLSLTEAAEGEQGTEAKKDMANDSPYMAPGGGWAELFKTCKDHSM